MDEQDELQRDGIPISKWDKKQHFLKQMKTLKHLSEHANWRQYATIGKDVGRDETVKFS